MKLLRITLACCLIAGCSDDSGSTPDSGSNPDNGNTPDQLLVDQAPGNEAGQGDLNTADTAVAQDTTVAKDAAPQDKNVTPPPDTGLNSCTTDKDCAAGKTWCVKGQCVPCDNSGLACKIACPQNWSLYTRNGCHPCACAPKNACTKDADCGLSAQTCYAGAFCWDWCPKNDPSCCYGNTCSKSGCTPPPPTGCWVRGCPLGQSCLKSGCSSSSCSCGSSGWNCSKDCGGGTCK